MTVKTTVSSKDIDEAYLQLKDIAKETPLQKIIIYLINMIVMFILSVKIYNG